MNGKHAICCHRCGGKWYEVGEDAEEDLNYTSWGRQPSRGRAPHDQSQHPKSPRKGKGGGKAKQDPQAADAPRQAQPRRRSRRRGKNAPTRAEPAPPQNQGAPVVALPQMGSDAQSWMSLLTTQQAALQAHHTTEEIPAPASSSAALPPPEMKKLLLSLKKDQEKLSPEVQELVKTMTIKEEKKEEKDLQFAAKSLGRARRDLQEAYEARGNLHQKWRNFLSMSVAQWQAFTTEFQTQEQAAIQQIQEARTALTQAKANLEVSQEPFHSPRDKENKQSDVQELMSEEETPDSGAQKLQEGLQNLTSSLKGLHQAAEAAHAEEQAAKRARLEGQKDVSSLPGGHALQPFASPGVPRP